jgi:streptomycin 6-kinase
MVERLSLFQMNEIQKIEKARDRLAVLHGEWRLTPDGEPFVTENSLLQAVRHEGLPAMLKIPMNREEYRGFQLLNGWDGLDAVRVYRYDAHAILMERAQGKRSLREMVICGREDEANGIIGDVVRGLHASRCGTVPDLVPLSVWFSSLGKAAELYGGVFVDCRATADELLNDPLDAVTLHGDIHYDNVLDGGDRGWLAIDPKGLLGERGFEYANLFCNPDPAIAGSAVRMTRQVPRIAGAAGIEASRLLRWVLAWAGLSAAWMIEDDKDPQLQLQVAGMASHCLLSQ